MSFGTIISCMLCIFGAVMALAFPFSKRLQKALSSPETDSEGESKAVCICIASSAVVYVLMFAGNFLQERDIVMLAGTAMWLIWAIVFAVVAIIDRKKSGLDINSERIPVSKRAFARLTELVFGLIYCLLAPIAGLLSDISLDVGDFYRFCFCALALVFLLVWSCVRERRRLKYIEKQEKYLGVDFDREMQGKILHVPSRSAGTSLTRDWFVCAQTFNFFVVHRRYIQSYKVNKRYMLDQQRIVVYDLEGGRMSVMAQHRKSWGPGIADKFERWVELGRDAE